MAPPAVRRSGSCTGTILFISRCQDSGLLAWRGKVESDRSDSVHCFLWWLCSVRFV